MNDQALREGVVLLFARDDGLDWLAAEVDRPDRPVTDEALLRARCRQALWERLVDGVDLRLWISRLGRDLFLTEAALEAGLGLEDAAQFWLWFDRTMWAQPALGTPEHLQADTVPAAAPADPAGITDLHGRVARSSSVAGADRAGSSLWNTSGAVEPDV